MGKKFSLLVLPLLHTSLFNKHDYSKLFGSCFGGGKLKLLDLIIVVSEVLWHYRRTDRKYRDTYVPAYSNRVCYAVCCMLVVERATETPAFNIERP